MPVTVSYGHADIEGAELRDRFELELGKEQLPLSSVVISRALSRAVRHVVKQIVSSGDGASLDDEFRRRLGIARPRPVARAIRAIWAVTPANLHVAAATILLRKIRLSQMPSPACIEENLPKDRRPTREELEEAWEACVRDAGEVTP